MFDTASPELQARNLRRRFAARGFSVHVAADHAETELATERRHPIRATWYHWSQLTPLPSKLVKVHALRAAANRSPRSIETNLLSLGVDLDRYREEDYERTQQIGVHFRLTPNARVSGAQEQAERRCCVSAAAC